MISHCEQLLYQQLQAQGIHDSRVLAAIRCVPRQRFVDEALAHQAWDNTALPIGFGQTISQPYIVARMISELSKSSPRRVLEIGTGSGYQTAILAQLFERVYSVELLEPLLYQARRRLKMLDLHNVISRQGDGWQGWQSKAPFDAIIVSAAARCVPRMLLEQLADGGVMVIPVGESSQNLQRISRHGEHFTTQILEAVRFVPLVEGSRG
ncbi:protein-L-isoaspartate(D-aspartate) O-methyltransferase [Dongshaea marina]|uniref:protein-L-isoaspartate(D-aspartate) O-methyltransferase n=1 Tax=Dongshaea marina TaxID=2047966 RepID=UPI000D3E9A07|nr:protein-L-isoaspartate(D-aspartate) O-methyltransferase [Dongshaea marina]